MSTIANINQWPDACLSEHQDNDDKTSEAKFLEHRRCAKVHKEEEERSRREAEECRVAEEVEARQRTEAEEAACKWVSNPSVLLVPF